MVETRPIARDGVVLKKKKWFSDELQRGSVPDPGINFKISYIAPKYARNHAGKHKNPPDSTLRKFSGSAHGTIGDTILVNFGNDLIPYNNIKKIYSAGGN